MTATTVVAALALASAAYGALVPRGTTTNPSDIAGHNFDYVVIGAGTAGLVLASRLTENSSVTVAVIEAGLAGDDIQDRINIPVLTYLEGVSVPGSSYDWGYFASALNRVQHWPRGKILGGSSAVNAEYVVRASKIEHDAWASLNPGAATDWSWEGLFPYMFVSENYHPPNDANATAASIKVDTSFHNNAGPIHSSYPYFMYDQANMWVPTLANLGVDTRDPGKGQGWGAYLTPNAINPATASRSYAKAYLDLAVGRPNLSVLLGYQATRISMGAKGPKGLPKPDYVEFAQSANSTRYNVTANKEVILSAGVIGTPQLLQLSGIGPKALLDSLQIPTVVDLPGVGEHLQDHVLIPVVWSTNASVTGDAVALSDDLKAQQLAIYRSGQFSQTLYSAANNGIAYINLRQLLGNDEATNFMGQLKNNVTNLLNIFYNNTNEVVKQGYNLTFQTEIDKVIDSNVGVIELLLSNTGTFNPTNKTLSIQASLQHPFSRGNVVISSTDPFKVPNITTNYLTSDADWVILRAGLRYARMVGNTAPLSSVITGEIQPGPGVVTDADIDNYIWTNAATQYHPASTSSQLPRDKGGVVDTELRVYGTEGLRVIDSSIIPIGLCAHLMMPTFAIGEKGAGIITGAPPPSTVVHNGGTKLSLTLPKGKTPLLTLLGVIYLALA